MRELVIDRLKWFILDSNGYGIPRYFDCDEEDHITDPDELNDMSDEELITVFESCVGFGG
jgi:hypothetical protein